MKLIITHKAERTSGKTKKDYVFLSYLDPKSGEAGKIICEKSQYAGLGLDESKINSSPSTLKSIVEVCDVVDASFGPTGQIESIE